MHCHRLISRILMFPARTIARRVDGCPAFGWRVSRTWLGMCANPLQRHNFPAQPRSSLLKTSAQGGLQFQEIKPAGFELFVHFGARAAWVASFVALIALLRHFAGRDEPETSTPP
jgi:hypothetical protein